jgi:hypothetical protein
MVFKLKSSAIEGCSTSIYKKKRCERASRIVRQTFNSIYGPVRTYLELVIQGVPNEMPNMIWLYFDEKTRFFFINVVLHLKLPRIRREIVHLWLPRIFLMRFKPDLFCVFFVIADFGKFPKS